MASGPPSSITVLLNEAAGGEKSAKDRLWAVLHEQLHSMARRQLAKEPAACDRQTTSLVNEAFIRLAGNEDVGFENRRHFFSAASRVMRQILVDDARRRNRVKRGEGIKPVHLEYDPLGEDRDAADLLAVDEAMERLEAQDPRKAEVVRLRYFAGLSLNEIAEVIGISQRTVDSEWQFAKAWLHRELTRK